MDHSQACNKIYNCGYATDPNYPQKLINIIETYKLHEFDLQYKIERLMIEMDNKELQRWLNLNGFTDKNGNKLEVDGKLGPLTKSAIEKAKSILSFILK
jgi:hypothetical protein